MRANLLKEKVNYLSLLVIENSLTKNLNFDDLIEKFDQQKALKKKISVITK